MFDVYELDIIKVILNNFKVNDIIISGLLDSNLIREILNYDASIVAISENDIEYAAFDIDVIDEFPLKILPNFSNYGAIFLNDDPNWYTTFNELSIIKKTNDEFPLVFICNNKFPHKHRDTYKNPNEIPDEFVHEYSKRFPICYNQEEIMICDGFYHSINENTPKNGVLTAIEDFIVENPEIGIMNINFIDEITILYPKSTITQIRINNIFDAISGKKIENIGFYDKAIKNKLLFSYVAENNLSDDDFNIIEGFKQEISQKNEIIDNYENKIQIHDSEIKYKDSVINGVESELSLKDSQIQHFESKLVNKENEINRLQKELNSANDEINLLNDDLNSKQELLSKKDVEIKNKIDSTEKKFKSNESKLKNQFKNKENTLKEKENQFKIQLEHKEHQISDINNELKSKEKELDDAGNLINILKEEYFSQNRKLDSNEYCISCFKEEISNNHLEIQYLKKSSWTKKILSPLSYFYLIVNSKPKELLINFKLYNALKNSKCFDIGYYLNNNEDIQNSKWSKYFSPELHYVCKGFNENRKFNKKYFNTNSKRELLNYLLTCEKL